MGETRAAIESPVATVSPKSKLDAVLDQLHDLVTTKERDLVTEQGQETKNRESIAKLRTAIFHAQEAKKQLEAY